MLSRIAVIAGVVALWSGAARAAPDTQAVTLENRLQLVAARMSAGESYDRATRAVQLDVTDERDQQIASAMTQGKTYREARLAIGERAEVVNARYNKHLAAMVNGGSHDAGWAASTR